VSRKKKVESRFKDFLPMNLSTQMSAFCKATLKLFAGPSAGASCLRCSNATAQNSFGLHQEVGWSNLFCCHVCFFRGWWLVALTDDFRRDSF